MSEVFSFDRISDLVTRLARYSPIEVLVELALIWVVVYAVVRFVQGTRAAAALKGLLVLVVITTVVSRVLGPSDLFQRISFLYDKFLALVALGLVVIFQPELRRALVRLSEAPFFRGTPPEIAFVVDELVDACAYLSKSRFGGLIVIERNIGLAGLVEGGTILNADLSAPLLKTVFFPGSALHDLAVWVKGKTVHAANVQLPLADPHEMPDPALGSRHRAAVGLSKECDALVVVVSEESGRCRIAERGRLSQPMSAAELGEELTRRLGRAARAATDPAGAMPAEVPADETVLDLSNPDLEHPELDRRHVLEDEHRKAAG
jgi:diadenylate cyclase